MLNSSVNHLQPLGHTLVSKTHRDFWDAIHIFQKKHVCFFVSSDSSAVHGVFMFSWLCVCSIYSTKIPGTLNSGTPIPILLPYHSHKNPLKYGNDMGGLWEGGPTIEGP